MSARLRRLRTSIVAVLVAEIIVPVVVVAATVRPAAGGEQAFSSYGITFQAAAVGTGGEIGASGGLVVLDAGVPDVAGRLDSTPSAAGTAAVIEPGALARTAVGQVNASAGQAIMTVPSAEAYSPGPASGGYDLASDVVAGPVEIRPGGARSSAQPAAATALAWTGGVGIATTTSRRGLGDTEISLRSALSRIPGAYPAQGSSPLLEAQETVASGDSSAQVVTGALDGGASVSVRRVVILGQIVLTGVEGTAQVTLTGGQHQSHASLSIGSASIAGMPVAIGPGGVTALGLPGELSTQVLSDALNAALSASGVSIRTDPPVQKVQGRSALADSGDVTVSATTAATPEVPGNTVSIILGRATATLSDEAPVPAPSPSLGSRAFAPKTSPASVAGTPAVGAAVGSSGAPNLGRPVTVPRRQPEALVALVGHRLPTRVVLAAFGVWQLLSLNILTLAVAVTGDKGVRRARA